MFYFAGIPLADAVHSEVNAWLEASIRPQDVFPLAYRPSYGAFTHGPVLQSTAEVPRPIKLNTLYWPYGASRFARAHFVVTSSQLESIQKVVLKQGGQESGKFTFKDGTNAIVCDLWMLPSTPLAQCAENAEMYVLNLVDDRYYWWGQYVNFQSETEISLWEDLYENIAASIGTPITVDPIPEAYLGPNSSYTTELGRLVPEVLDAIAFSVQQRLVRSFDGSLRMQNYATSAAINVSNQVASWTPYAGGTYDL